MRWQVQMPGPRGVFLVSVRAPSEIEALHLAWVKRGGSDRPTIVTQEEPHRFLINGRPASVMPME